jgi:tetratricopeptide (TPR) repeat protein
VKISPHIVLLLAGSAAFGCRAGPADDQRTESMTLEQMRRAREQLKPEVRAQLDSGNAAYGERDYEAALLHYHSAAELDENAAAAWFGVFMVENARGDAQAAEAALRRARAAAPKASLIEPGAPR